MKGFFGARKSPIGLSRGAKIAIYAVMALVIVCCLAPFLMVISASFSSEEAVKLSGVSLFPRGFTLAAYRQLLAFPEDIVDSYAISLFVLAVGTVLNILLTSMTAYPLSRSDYKYRGITSFFLFFTVLFGGGMIPTYILYKQFLGLYDNVWVYILPGMLVPSNVFMLRVYMQGVPESLYEASKLDGAGEFTTFRRVALPLSLPGVLTVTLFGALMYWNDATTGIYFIDSPELVNLPLLLNRYPTYIADMKSQMISSGLASNVDAIPETTMTFAMTIVVTLPVLVLFMMFQKYFVQGLTAGAVKG